MRAHLLVPLLRTLLNGLAGALLIVGGTSKAQHAVFQSKDYATNNGLVGLLQGELKGYRIEAHFFRASEYELCIVDEGDATPVYGNLEQAMRRNNCVAGINGGYFAASARRSPIGLLRHASRSIAPFSTGSFTVAGTLYDTGVSISLDRSTALRLSPQHMHEAIQGGPFLIDQFHAVAGLEATGALPLHRLSLCTNWQTFCCNPGAWENSVYVQRSIWTVAAQVRTGIRMPASIAPGSNLYATTSAFVPEKNHPRLPDVNVADTQLSHTIPHTPIVSAPKSRSLSFILTACGFSFPSA